jgi:hypothetical protein
MIQIVREFVVKENARGRLELALGPGGAWSKLFARSAGFRGTMLLRDAEDPLRYLTFDLWDTKDQWQQTLAECSVEYSDLEAGFSDWTRSKTELGTFRVVAEATVRPRGRARRRGPRATR